MNIVGIRTRVERVARKRPPNQPTQEEISERLREAGDDPEAVWRCLAALSPYEDRARQMILDGSFDAELENFR